MDFRKYLSGKRIAIVGGAGFIGHNLALKLKENHAIPFIIDGLQVNNLGAFSSNTQSDTRKELYLNLI